jgi:hypothetical protein
VNPTHSNTASQSNFCAATVYRRKLKLKTKFEAVYDVIVSSVETIGAFNTGFDAVNLHRPTTVSPHAVFPYDITLCTSVQRRRLILKAKLEATSSCLSFKR